MAVTGVSRTSWESCLIAATLFPPGPDSPAFQNHKILQLSMADFHVHPQSVQVEEGGVSRFQCHIHGLPEPLVSWEKNGVPVDTDNERYTLLPTGVLQITGVRAEDSGIFRCVATNIASVKRSLEARLTVSGFQSAVYKEPMILVGPENLTLTVHQTAILECVATGYPRPIVSWSRLDGRPIGVEGIQVLGTGNLMISDLTVQHSGVYVCAANKPGTRVRRTAQGRLVVQVQSVWLYGLHFSVVYTWEHLVTAVFCSDPDPAESAMAETQKVKHFKNTLTIYGISLEDEAIYQCIAENSAGSTQASARLTVLWADGLPSPPRDVKAVTASSTAIQVLWSQPLQNTQEIIGYVLHIRKTIGNKEHCLLKTRPPVVISELCLSIARFPSIGLDFILWLKKKKKDITQVDLLSHPSTSPSSVSTGALAPLNITQLDPSVVYEVKLLAFNQHGEGNSSVRFVSLRDTVERSVLNTPCNCVKDEQNKTSTTGIIIGIHIGVTCIIFCVLFLMFGYRGRLLMCKNVQDHLATPQVVRNQTGSSAGLVLNRVSRRDLDETGNTGKQPADTNELERLFPGTPLREQPDKGNETDNIPSTLHDETQISTLPLDEFSIMEERQPPSESAPVGGATGPSENHLHRAEEQG
ncbi:UNVERIFIED_CONTAM: hypothetical protein FKN15_049138 [Acipenser sinensis]